MKGLKELIQFRKPHPFTGWGNDDGGYFVVPSPCRNEDLGVIASTGGGWDHVSVSRVKQCPSWTEMAFIKRLFFKPDEVVVQLHPAEKDYINFMPYCLHLWRPQNETIPLPPEWMV